MFQGSGARTWKCDGNLQRTRHGDHFWTVVRTVSRVFGCNDPPRLQGGQGMITGDTAGPNKVRMMPIWTRLSETSECDWVLWSSLMHETMPWLSLTTLGTFPSIRGIVGTDIHPYRCYRLPEVVAVSCSQDISITFPCPCAGTLKHRENINLDWF